MTNNSTNPQPNDEFLFKIPCTWSMAGYVEVASNDLHKALSKALDAKLPADGEYLEDSFSIDHATLYEMESSELCTPLPKQPIEVKEEPKELTRSDVLERCHAYHKEIMDAKDFRDAYKAQTLVALYELMAKLTIKIHRESKQEG